jgi:hypothetical protein
MRHGVAAGQQQGRRPSLERPQVAVNKKPSLAREQDHVSGVNGSQWLRFDGEDIAGKERRQHAVTECRQAQCPALSENFDRKIVLGLIPGLVALKHGLVQLRTPSSAASAGLHGGRKFAASQCHRLKHFFQAEFRFPVRPFAWLLAVKNVLLFVSRWTVFMGHKNSTGLCSFSPKQAQTALGEKSVREVYNRVPNIC